MKEVSIQRADRYAYDFIPSEFLGEGKTEYWQRDAQSQAYARTRRKLRADEIEVLIKNYNSCSDWNDLLVSDPFDPSLIKNSCFYGLVRLGSLRNVVLQHHDYRVPTGIRNSTIISCDIGDDCSIQECAYLSHYIFGNTVILSHIDEMATSNHAKFGNGILKDGETEDVRVWIDVMNEAGGRSILPFDGMIPADAYLWASWRDDTTLVRKLAEITQKRFGSARGAYGVVGSSTVIKSTGIIKDVLVGECAYIKGANKLKNLTINSSEDEPTQIGEGVELVNGIIDYGCRIFYGSKAVRFVMGRNSSLKYGARLIHSVLGDNSTVSCCEMLNNLIFPAHEQHHNNSFLIASLVQGLSNMAAGATVGSNHNSRANDGELRAGRGFWPGLCVTLKHPSRFASYVLIAKGDYPHELDIPFPFSLLNYNLPENRLEIMPAYFWMHNMYALERNAWKTGSRDKRAVKVQKIESDYLAPDTAEEILRALTLLEIWTSKAAFKAEGRDPRTLGDEELIHHGRELLLATEDRVSALELVGESLERRQQQPVILKPRRAYRAYLRMLRWYAIRGIMSYLELQPTLDFDAAISGLDGQRVSEWINLGGQIVPAHKVDEMRRRIGNGDLADWDAIHGEYENMYGEYPLDRARHSFAVLNLLRADYAAAPGVAIASWDAASGSETGEADTKGAVAGGQAPVPDPVPAAISAASGTLSAADFSLELDLALGTRAFIEAQIRSTREKDHRDHFRRMTYRNEEELRAVIGDVDSNPFVKMAATETAAFVARVAALKARL